MAQQFQDYLGQAAGPQDHSELVISYTEIARKQEEIRYISRDL